LTTGQTCVQYCCCHIQ